MANMTTLGRWKRICAGSSALVSSFTKEILVNPEPQASVAERSCRTPLVGAVERRNR